VHPVLDFIALAAVSSTQERPWPHPLFRLQPPSSNVWAAFLQTRDNCPNVDIRHPWRPVPA